MLGALTCVTPSCRPRELGLLKIPIMQVRKPRPGEFQPLAQVHTMNKRPAASNHRDPKAQALNRLAHCLTVMRPGVGGMPGDPYGGRGAGGGQEAGATQAEGRAALGVAAAGASAAPGSRRCQPGWPVGSHTAPCG